MFERKNVETNVISAMPIIKKLTSIIDEKIRKYLRKNVPLPLLTFGMECISLFRFKFITYAPYRFKFPFVGNALKLFAKPFNVDVNRARVAVIFKSPNFVKKLVARENPVGVACKVINKFKLLRRRVNMFAVYGKLIV